MIFGAKRFTTMAIDRSGTRARPATSGEMLIVNASASGNITSVRPMYIGPGPTTKRTASTSLGSREIRSPVRVRSK